ncbi:MAG: GldG family protein [Clostridia bacterium]|nr:GldG family protein [Clostridia bacterium]
MNILKRRNFKYSSASAAFTAVVIVLVMLLNAAFTALAARFSLYADLTSNELWTLSDTAKDIIAGADGEITITFCHEPDYIESNSFMKYISNTAKEMEKEFNGKIHLRYVNSKLDPNVLKPYKYTTETLIRETDIIVEKGNALTRAEGESPSEFRKLSYEAFFVTDTNSGEVWAYNGEEIFAAACLAVTADETPSAYFTTGHGESIDNASIASFYNTITLAGFNVGFIDLVKDEIPEDCRLLIINDPKRDFAGYSIYDPDAVSEIAKIDEFLDGDHTLMVFKDPETEYLQNLEEFLYEWGVVFGDGVVTDTANSITMDGKALVATYPSETLGSSLQKEISGQAAPPKTIVKSVSPIYVPDTYMGGLDENGNSTNTYEYYGNNAYRELSAVLTASPDAVVVADDGTTEAGGNYNLMTITREMNTRDNDQYYSYVMAACTKYFTTADYLESNTYGNEDILYYAFRVMGREKVPANIDFKEFATTKIENMTSAEAIRTTVLLIAVLPVAFAICGIIITTRRKYR